MVLIKNVTILKLSNLMLNISLNNIKSLLLLVIIFTGTFYTFILDGSASPFVIDLKRALIFSFIICEFFYLTLQRIDKSFYYALLFFNIIYIALLILINTTIYHGLYLISSILFIFSVFSHTYRLSQDNFYFFLKYFYYFCTFLCTFFSLLIFLYFGFEIKYAQQLFYYGFGNDYANFAVWAAYISILITFLQVRFNQAIQLTLFYHLILLSAAVLAGGRTGCIMIVCSISVNLYFNFKGRIRYLPFKILLGISLLIIILATFFENSFLVYRFTRFTSGAHSYYTILDIILSGRLTIISGALDMFINKSSALQQMFGHGILNVYISFNDGWMAADTSYQIHNFLVHFLLEAGVFGCISFLAIWLYPFFTKYKYGYKPFILLLYLIGSLNAFISPGSFFTGINACAAFWVMMAIATQFGKNKSYLDSKTINQNNTIK